MISALTVPSIPRYYQIAQVLRLRVQSHELADGALATEHALCEEFGVSRTTVRRALGCLKEQGLLASRPGVGTRGLPKDVRKIVRSSGDPLHAGLRTRPLLVSLAAHPAPRAVADFFSIGRAQPVLRVIRVHRLDGEPLSVVVSYLPAHLARGLTRSALREPMHDVLWQRFGLRFKRSVHTLRVARADAEVATLLAIELADPVLKIQSSVYLDDGSPIRWTDNFFREDRYEYSAEMEWPAPRGAPPSKEDRHGRRRN